MKVLKAFTIFFITTSFCYSQVDCKPFVPTEKGVKWILSNYSAKGKLTGTTHYEVIDKTIDGDNVIFKVQVKSFDQKDKEIAVTSYEAACKNGVFELDMSVMLNSTAMQNFKDMDVEVDASNYELPKLDAEPGTQLSDGTLKVSVVASGGLGIGMTVFVTDRKVEAQEKVTTPAGDFQCTVITQKVSTKMMVKVQGASKEWYAENIGLVRSESYNKKGKLQGYSELTKLEL